MLTDDQKLEYTKDAFNRKIDNVDDWDNFKTLLSGITKTAVINFVKNNLQKRRQSLLDSSEIEIGWADGISEVITELDNI